MGQEIERKFLVKDDSFRKEAYNVTHITQGYLCSTRGRTVRIRLRDDKGYITVKGPLSQSGTTRFEWEMEIPAADAESMLQLCGEERIDKERYLIDYSGHTFEVDVFHSANEGLTVAEIELASEDEPFERPSWLAEEVTGDRRYCNSMLLAFPFCEWPENNLPDGGLL